MKCINCGTKMTVSRENVKYKALPSIVLGNVEVRRCPECGEEEVVIPRIELLHRALAMMLAEKSPKLTAVEIRFLRKYLGWSGSDFAQVIGVSPETISRWENNKESMGSSAERLLRYLAMTLSPAEAYLIDLLKTVARVEAAPLKVKVIQKKQDWELAKK